MAEKTPVSMLQELCITEGVSVPMYDAVPNEGDSKIFTYIVHAFDMFATGSGRSKREAKHAASERLIADLKKSGRFDDKLKHVPHTPRPTSENDAVGTLLDICVQRNWPIASFVVLQASGQPHAPQFTVVCKLASIQRSGNFSTKKGAKQLAAQAMLNVVQQLPSATDNDKQVAPIASIDAPTPAKVMRTYRELKNSQSLGTDCKHKVFNLSNRHKYFVKLPKEDIQAAVNIIQGCDDSFAVGSSDRDRLDLILKALKIDYVVNDIENHFEQHKALIMLGDYDSVHVGPENELYANVLDYLKIMLDLKMIY